MKFTRSMLMGTGGLLAGLTLTLLAPKAAHAVVATLVEVANTTSSPVNNLDTERNARIPYQSTAYATCGAGISNCFFSPTSVPAGYRLVVQDVGAYLALNPGSTPPVGVLVDPGSFSIGLGGGAVGPTLSGIAYSSFNQAVTAYFNAGDQPRVVVYASFTSITQVVVVTGYLQNCALSACPAIQE
jgi:hypothetical protein